MKPQKNTTTTETRISKISKSADRHQKWLNDRQRRRQIIAKLAQKRKQYQIGIGIPLNSNKSDKIKSKSIKNQQDLVKQHETITNKANNTDDNTQIDKEEEKHIELMENVEEEHEHKSGSVSTSLSRSPIQPQNYEMEEYDSLYNDRCYHDDDGRDEEIKMLKAQNQRLSHKLEHVNTELVETQVFLRSERKRNKNLSHKIKLKEDEIGTLSQSIEDLE